MEYWEELSDKYLFNLEGMNSSQITKAHREHQKQEVEMISKYGESSWNIQEFAQLLFAEKISMSKFRELVRYEMNENNINLKNKNK
jgi:hypothetical protein